MKSAVEVISGDTIKTVKNKAIPVADSEDP
jgi:hypothetical protein